MVVKKKQTGDRPEILIVDDTPASLYLLEHILVMSGYHVRAASDGPKALQSVANEPPDLILLDIKMPEMDGYDVCRRLKSDEKYCNIPVIFISALEEDTEKVKGFDVGGVDYITKPFANKEILARVRTHLGLRELTERLEQKVRERTAALTTTNQRLVQEIADRRQAEHALQQAHDNLEQIVRERTAELMLKNRQLVNSIAEQRRIADALRESEEKYRSLVDHIVIGVSLISSNMEILTINNQMKKWFPDIDATQKPICYETFNTPPRKTVCSYCPTHKTLRDGQVHESHTETLTKNGLIYFRIVSSPIKDKDGNIIAAIEMVEDITERKKMQEQLRESETMYRTIFETTASATIIVEEDNTISLVNTEFEKITGRSKQKTEGKHLWTEFVAKEDHAKIETYQRLRRIDPLAAPRNYEIRIIDGKGRKREAYTTAAMLPGTSKSVISLLDITELKQVERSLRESEKRLRFLSSRLLTAQENERRRISMEIHDELGQNLAVLKLQLDTLAGKLRKDQVKLKADVKKTLDFIDRIIEEMRRLSRDLSPTIIEDLQLCGSLKWLLHNFQKHTHIRIVSDIADIDDQFGHEDQIILYRIFQEALNNINKHAQPNEVSVAINNVDDQVVIRIEDDGKGFDPIEHKNRHVTERGLGLAALDERTRMLGGAFDISSQMGKGTCITIKIPTVRTRGAV